MPLRWEKHWADSGRLGLWHLSETTNELRQLYGPGADNDLTREGVHHPQKQREFLASRVLLRQVMEGAGQVFSGLYKDTANKPFLQHSKAHISLTHSKSWVAVAWHPQWAVGLDVEPISPKLQAIAPKFLQPDELAHAAGRLSALARYWTAKEALYKLYGQRGVSFREHMKIAPFMAAAESLQGELHFSGKKHSVDFQIFMPDHQHLLAAAAAPVFVTNEAITPVETVPSFS